MSIKIPSSYITLDEVVEEALSIVPNPTDIDRVKARQWAYSCVEELPWGDFQQDAKELDLENFKAYKPADFLSSIDLAIFDNNGNEYKYRYSKGDYIREDNVIGTHINRITVAEFPTFFSLSSNADGITKVKLKYWKLPFDENGFPCIMRHQKLAVIHFIRWNWMMSKGADGYEVDRAERTYEKFRARAKGKGKIPSMLEARAIAYTLPTLIRTARQHLSTIR